MTVTTRRTALLAGVAALAQPAVLRAQPSGPIRIGVLNDQNGSFRDLSGTDSLHAMRMAVEEFGGSVLGLRRVDPHEICASLRYGSLSSG